jgi:hypothetical protein
VESVLAKQRGEWIGRDKGPLRVHHMKAEYINIIPGGICTVTKAVKIESTSILALDLVPHPVRGQGLHASVVWCVSLVFDVSDAVSWLLVDQLGVESGRWGRGWLSCLVDSEAKWDEKHDAQLLCSAPASLHYPAWWEEKGLLSIRLEWDIAAVSLTRHCLSRAVDPSLAYLFTYETQVCERSKLLGPCLRLTRRRRDGALAIHGLHVIGPRYWARRKEKTKPSLLTSGWLPASGLASFLPSLVRDSDLECEPRE